jgi:hypothetical protein
MLYGVGLTRLWDILTSQEIKTVQGRWFLRLARLSLLVTPLIIWQPSPDPRVLDYYGSVWIFVIAAQLAETFLIIVLVLRPPRLSISTNVLWILLLVLFSGFSVILVFVLLYRGDAHNILAAVWLLGVYPAMLWLAYALPADFQPRILSSQRLWKVACGVLVVVGIGISLASLRTLPNFMNTDEPWTLSYADTTHRTGLIYASMFPVDQIPVRSSPRIYYLLDAWMNLIGQNDIYAARAFALLAGLLLLPVVFVVGRTLYDSFTALIAVFLLATSVMWVVVSHVARPEMWLTLAVWSGIALLAVAQRSKSRYSPILAFAGGLVLALSAELHLFGAVYCLIVGIWRLALVRSWRAEWGQIAALIVGGGIGALVFASYHLLPDPSAFSLGFNNESGISRSLASILAIVLRRYTPYFAANPVEFLLLLGAALYAVFVLRDRTRLGLIALLSFLFYAIFITDANMYYVMVWLPAVILLAAVTIRSLKWSAQVVVILLLFSMVAVTAFRARDHVVARWNERALAALETAAAHVPPDGTVVAQPLFYLGLRNEDFISYAYVRALYPEQEGISGLAVIRPCYLITHDQDWIFAEAPQILSYGMNIDLPQNDSVLQPDYHTIDTVDTELGTFRIWQNNDGCSEQ